MALLRLDISNFRNIHSVKIEPITQGFNVIYGNNGSGKTTLLEAIYFLSLGRSFRSSALNPIIANDATKFSLFAHVLTHSNPYIPIGLEREQNGQVKIRIAGTDVRSNAELASLTAVQLINSQCFTLLEGPIFRRKYLDWGAFYQNPEFLRCWQRFERALKQRNAALRENLSKRELDIWSHEVIESANILNQIREDYLKLLLPLLTDLVSDILTVHNVEMKYQAGWNSDLSYEAVLSQSLDKDRYLGYTQYGPHRADFKINVNQYSAKDILSRGQQKLFICAMLLAQGILLREATNKRPIYLIDDLPAELDSTGRSKIMSLLSQQDAQIFVTAIERGMLESSLSQSPTKMFHVEHGGVTEVQY